MPVTERLMGAGQWSIALDPATNKVTRDLLDYFGHIYIFDTPMRSGLNDATMIASSRWGGILRRRQTPWAMSGVNMIAWLGDEDGKGPIIEVAGVGSVGTPAAFSAYMTAILAQCPAVTAGTATAVAGTHDPAYIWVTCRQALDNVCAIFNAEYRVNKDATIDTAPVGSSGMFKQTPTAVAMRRSSGRDLSVVGLSLTQLDVEIDAEEYIARQIVRDSTGVNTAAAGSATPYKDLHGNLIKMTKLTISTLTNNASAATLAANLVAAGQVLRNAVTITTDEFDIDRDVIVGDWIWVYDADGSMVDTTNPIRYRGSTIYPLKLRVLAITWPIERGMGVWYRDRNGVWTDLTNYVLFEAPGAHFEVGVAVRAQLTRDQWDRLHS
jgi:hypothetical protein